MSSYYDTILKRVESEMEKGDFAEAMKLLEEELSIFQKRMRSVSSRNTTSAVQSCARRKSRAAAQWKILGIC